MSPQPNRCRRLWSVLLALGAVVATLALLVRLWLQRRRLARPSRAPSLAAPVIPPGVSGLTVAEAEARRLEGQDNVIQFQPLRPRGEIVRDNVLTIFNLSLIGMALFQLMVGLYLDGLISLGAAALNIALNVRQELMAGKKISELERTMRPQATVVRAGHARNIDPSEIVQGDVLVVGPGDQFLADGELLSERSITVDQSMLTTEGTRAGKRAGDPVYAGSFCLAGRAAYQAQKVGDERLVAKLTAEAGPAQKSRTPTEQVLNRILSVMLVIMIVLLTVLVARFSGLDEPTNVDVGEFLHAAGLIFSLAPAGMYFMIFLTYVGGTVQLAQRGALVYRARSIESLAHAGTLCVTEASIRTGTDVELETVDAPEGDTRPRHSRLRQILGDFAHSGSGTGQPLQAVAEAFPGEKRAVWDEAPFLTVYGWRAIAFDHDDMRGVFVLGEPEMLEAHLLDSGEEESAPEEEKEEGDRALAGVRDRVGAVGASIRSSIGAVTRRFRPSKEISEEEAEQQPEQEALTPLHNGEGSNEKAEAGGEAEAEQPSGNPIRRFLEHIRPQQPDESEATEEPEQTTPADAAEGVVYLFAYRPELMALHDASGQPQLPEELAPLCYLRFTQRPQSDAVDAIAAFVNTGVKVKLFTPGAPDRTLALLQQAGLEDESVALQHVISGQQLERLKTPELERAALENVVFGYTTPQQVGQVVEALRAQGEAVAVVGDGPNDLTAMQLADLSIAWQSSSQAALGAADIILLQDSPHALLELLDRGQRIVNGLLDVLKLNLTQLFYLTVLIFVFWRGGLGFPYEGKQGSLISTLTVSLPATALSLWSARGAIPNVGPGRALAWFVGPAAGGLSLGALMVWSFFNSQTGEAAYAQLTLTHFLVFSGLTLVLLVRPPRPGAGSDAARAGDSRFTALALLLLTLFFLATFLPLGYKLFLVARLRQPLDYVIVVAVVLAWVSTTKILWHLVPLERLSPRLLMRPGLAGQVAD